jgi:hypothetical protein
MADVSVDFSGLFIKPDVVMGVLNFEDLYTASKLPDGLVSKKAPFAGPHLFFVIYVAT